MLKLVHADFSRLTKYKLFWLGLVVMAGIPLFAVGSRYYDRFLTADTVWESADGIWFVGGLFLAVILAVLVSLFIGTEYSDGTIRNMLIIGHTRSEIYLSKQITCIAVSLLYHLVFIAVLFGSGSLLLKSWDTPLRTLASLTLLSLTSVIALSAFFNMLAMLIPSRSAGAVLALLTAIAMLAAAMTAFSMLSAPEFIDNAYRMNDVGEIVKSDPIPNPMFLSGLRREVYRQILYVLPTGQMLLFGTLSFTAAISILPLYAVAVSAVCIVVGLMVFRRKDIR